MRDEFAHAICAVTGGAQGIGWATARAFAARGSRVYIADISEHHLREAQALADASPWPERFHLTRCDVADQAQVTAWLAQIYHDTQRIDVLVNNAAFIRWQDVLDMSVAEVEQTMQVGFNAIVVYHQGGIAVYVGRPARSDRQHGVVSWSPVRGQFVGCVRG